LGFDKHIFGYLQQKKKSDKNREKNIYKKIQQRKLAKDVKAFSVKSERTKQGVRKRFGYSKVTQGETLALTRTKEEDGYTKAFSNSLLNCHFNSYYSIYRRN
jgi:hypothetical protein